MRPIFFRKTSSGIVLILCPSMVMTPEVGSNNLGSNAAIVDLPLPVAPTMPMEEPFGILNVISSRAGIDRPG